jgi:hypothetical protein
MYRLAALASVLVVLLIGGNLTSRVATTTAQEDEGSAFAGAWSVTITVTDGPSFPSSMTLGDKGTVQVVGIPAVPSQDGAGVLFTSTALGAWEATGPNTAVITFTHFRSDQDGQFQGTLTPRQSITLSEDGQSFTGDYVTTFADAEGTEAFTVTGTLEGKRIVAEGPEAAGTPTA